MDVRNATAAAVNLCSTIGSNSTPHVMVEQKVNILHGNPVADANGQSACPWHILQTRLDAMD